MKIEVCILGDGIVGRTLALALADKGIRVGLVQPAAAPQGPDVRAYAINHSNKALLESVKGWPLTGVTPVRAIEVIDQAQAAVQFGSPDPVQPSSTQTPSASAEPLAWIVDAAAIEAELAKALAYAPKIKCLTEATPAELTVVCEGKGRVVATQLGTTAQVFDYQQTALACRLSCANDHSHTARQWFQDGQIVALLPQSDQHVSLVWSTTPAHAAQLLALSPDEFAAALMAVGAGEGQGAGDMLGQLTLTSERHVWPLRLSQLDHWSGPGWAILGDAAHTVHPMTGQGLNLGLGDVQELTQVLTHRPYWRSLADPVLLRQYERARKTAFTQVSTVNDTLHKVFTHPHPAVAQLRRWVSPLVNGLTPLKHLIIQGASRLG